MSLNVLIFVIQSCSYCKVQIIIIIIIIIIHSLFQLLYRLFLSQTADPPLSKATKVARLQLELVWLPRPFAERKGLASVVSKSRTTSQGFVRANQIVLVKYRQNVAH